MTEERTEERVLTKRDEVLPLYMGEAKGILALADRLMRTHPSVKEYNMNQEECLAMAQYFTVNDANPWRGDIYVYRDKRGKIVYVDSYKILARWAKDDCPYDHKFEALEPNGDERHRIRCWILRDDRKQAMREYVDLGAPWNEAYELVAVYADGVVRTAETEGRNKPPTGWTWEQRARTRAYKAAMRLSHGAPTPRQLYESAMTVNGTRTLKEDWENDAEELTPHEIERLAELKAQTREYVGAWEQLTGDEQQAKLKENTDLLRGEEGFEGFGDEPSHAERLTQGEAEWEGTDAAAQDRAELERMTTEVGQPTTHAEDVKLTHEQVAAGLEKIKAEQAAKKPPPGTQEQPASQKAATVTAKGWSSVVVGFVKETDYYIRPDGEPDMVHLTRRALELGYPEIRDDNLMEVLDALALAAEDAQAQEAENETRPQWAPGDEEEAGQQALGL